MKLETKSSNKMSISNIREGEVFFIISGGSKEYYMRIRQSNSQDVFNAVKLDDGTPVYIFSDVAVYYCEAKLVIEE